MPAMERQMAMNKAAAPQFQQESFSEYHLYSLSRKTSVEDKETKQISLLQAPAFPSKKFFMVNGQNYYYHNQQTPGAPLKDPVMVYYKFRNEERAPSIPLPSGNVAFIRRTQKAAFSSPVKTASTTPQRRRCQHPHRKRFRRRREHKQTDYKRIDTHTWKWNLKSRCATTRTDRHRAGKRTHRVLGNAFFTYKYKKTRRFAAQFIVPVAKDGTSVLKYRIRAAGSPRLTRRLSTGLPHEYHLWRIIPDRRPSKFPYRAATRNPHRARSVQSRSGRNTATSSEHELL